jgi:tRNA threonylcarbamoyl adenosine modification protein (Sua5/YciO/YrdC/YwlC family)
MSEGPVAEAADAAIAGDLIVLPTDTVYGIATRPDEPEATARLFRAKGRSGQLALPVLVPSLASGAEIVDLVGPAERLARAVWPGAVTLVLPRRARSATWQLGGDGTTIGVRVPHHPLALAVLARTGPLAATSANRSGAPTPTGCEAVREIFGEQVAVYLCEDQEIRAVASTVVDLAHGEPRILRRGDLGPADLRRLLAD